MARPPNSPPTIRQRRYRLLLQQLTADEGLPQGKLGARVGGVSQSLIGQVINGGKDAGEPTIEKARLKLRIRDEFFTDERLDNPHWADFVEGERTESADVKSALQALLDQWSTVRAFRPEAGEAPDVEEQGWINTQLDFRNDRRAGLEVTPTLILDRLLERRRQQRGRVAERPMLDVTIRTGRITVDEPRRKK